METDGSLRDPKGVPATHSANDGELVYSAFSFVKQFKHKDDMQVFKEKLLELVKDYEFFEYDFC